jgi:Mg2+-importing ATPase
VASFRTYAGRSISSVLETLDSALTGLSHEAARARLASNGPNRIRKGREGDALTLLAKQLASPLTLLLVLAALISLVTRAYADSAIVLGIVGLSIALSFAQEFRAARAVAALTARVVPRARVLRAGAPMTVSTEELVVGDVVLLSAGSLVPADALVLESNGCLVDEAILTGETFPSTKRPAPLVGDAPLARCVGAVFAGTNVRSGTARAVVVATGMQTEIGKIARDIERRAPETEFERGVREFGVFIS